MENNFTIQDVFESLKSKKCSEADNIKQDYIDLFEDKEDSIKKIGSPLESSFYASLLKADLEHPIVGEALKILGYDSAIYTQYKVKDKNRTFYPDFNIEVVNLDYREIVANVFIEIDGHQFHEKTKEQVRHDKARERALLSHCDGIVRFSGSEVYRDSDACAEESINTIAEKFAKHLLRRGN